MAYDKKKKQIYLAFNDYLFKLNRKGRVLDTGSFHTGREFEVSASMVIISMQNLLNAQNY